MNLNQAIEHANAFFFPELLYGSGYQAMDSERAKNEEAISILKDEFFSNPKPSFSFDIVRELADRNRDLCDQIGSGRLGNAPGSSLARGLSDDDIAAGIGALQGRTGKQVMREIRGDRTAFNIAYVSKKIKGSVTGIDIETTDRYPDRGYIVNVGWEFMDLTSDAEPHGAQVAYCGIPERYEAEGVPLERIHHITWNMVAGKTPFRQDKELQKRILQALKKNPFMAHNAAFEDSWFIMNLDGYAEARKAGKIKVIDTRDICRRLDGEVVTLPRESAPAALENWARRRGTLSADEAEKHLGIDDTDLMLKTVQAEFNLKGMFEQ